MNDREIENEIALILLELGKESEEDCPMNDWETQISQNFSDEETETDEEIEEIVPWTYIPPLQKVNRTDKHNLFRDQWRQKQSSLRR